MSNKVTKQKSDRPYNIKRLGRKLKDKELLNAKDEIAEFKRRHAWRFVEGPQA